jgi:cell division protein FtsL
MKGRATLFCICLAVAVGFGLFHVKYKVQALEEELARLNSQIVHEQEQLHVLRAEWAYLNRPERLEDLNSRFLGLAPVTPAQLGRLSDLPPRPIEEAEQGEGEEKAKDLPQAKPVIGAIRTGAPR